MEGLILLRKQPASIKLDTKFYFLQALAVQPQKFLFISVAEPSRFHSRRISNLVALYKDELVAKTRLNTAYTRSTHFVRSGWRPPIDTFSGKNPKVYSHPERKRRKALESNGYNL